MAPATRKPKKKTTRKAAKVAGGKAPGKTAKRTSKRTAKRTAKKAAKKAASRKTTKTVKKTATRKTAASRSSNWRGDRRTLAPRKPAANPGASGESIHCTLALTGHFSMVLPTSVIAEITDYSPPAPLDNTPGWLLGQVEWEDWQVPVISYGALVDGDSPETATAQSRIMVVKSLSSTTRVPFIGVLVREIPKLAKVGENDMQVTGDEGKSRGVHCRLKLSGQDAVIPDLDRLSQLVAHAAYGTIDKEGQVGEA